MFTLTVRARPCIREASILPRLINNQTTVRHYHPTAGLYLNRIFVEKSEVCVDEETVILKSPDDRFQHIDSILKIKENDMIKMGVIDCGVTDTATVVEKTDDSVTINIGSVNNLTVTPKPSIDLILAFPRPARLTWLFPVISSLGVGRISLIRAAKTEKGYMASHYYKSMNDKLRKLLMLGLSQAAVDCWMPHCVLYPSHDIQEFFSQIDDLYPQDEVLRVLAHPLKVSKSECNSQSRPITNRRQINNNLDVDPHSTLTDTIPSSHSSSVPFHQLQVPQTWVHEKKQGGSNKLKRKRIVLAVGPDGGWSDDEIAEMTARGFIKVHMLGDRVLRTDIAVPALLALADEWYRQHIEG